MGWGELGRAGQGKHRLFRTVERKITKGCIHYEQIDKMRQDLIRFLLTSLEIRKKREKEFVEALMLFVTSLDWCHVEKLFRMTI